MIRELQAPADWRELVFISDLHLGPDTPRTFAALQGALGKLQADALFILGDLCEVWVGDDARELPWAQELVRLLSEVATRMPVYFQHGNRDFLLGPAMAQACGLQLLDEVVRLRAFGQTTVIVHGDAQCLDDKPYQAFRAQVRNPAWQQGFLQAPLQQRLAIAAQMRAGSIKAQSELKGEYGDLDTAACEQLLQDAGAQTLLHGHTHRPALHTLTGGSRLVLCDWDFDHGQERGELMRYSAAGWQRQAL